MTGRAAQNAAAGPVLHRSPGPFVDVSLSLHRLAGPAAAGRPQSRPGPRLARPAPGRPESANTAARSPHVCQPANPTLPCRGSLPTGDNSSVRVFASCLQPHSHRCLLLTHPDRRFSSSSSSRLRRCLPSGRTHHSHHRSAHHRAVHQRHHLPAPAHHAALVRFRREVHPPQRARHPEHRLLGARPAVGPADRAGHRAEPAHRPGAAGAPGPRLRQPGAGAPPRHQRVLRAAPP